MPHAAEQTDAILDAARTTGFSHAAITHAEPLARGAKALGEWLQLSYHGSMTYMERDARSNPRTVHRAARSILVVALPYGHNAEPLLHGTLAGVVAKYATGADYHYVLKAKLKTLAQQCEHILGRKVEARACVDTAPLLERELAERSGLAFIGKNTMAIIPGLGSHFFLGEIVLDVELASGTPASPKCGSCTTCIDRCPTHAFVRPYVLDARRCISYLTIEHRGAIPLELREGIGARIFGCDLCQDVCPYNAKPRDGSDALETDVEGQVVQLEELLTLTAAGYRRWVKGRATQRATRHQLARNAAIALGNTKHPSAVRPLSWALEHHISPMVRGHAAWALGNIATRDAIKQLQRSYQRESHSTVLEEIDSALRNFQSRQDETRNEMTSEARESIDSNDGGTTPS